MTDIEQLVEEIEQHEKNLADFEDIRFGEIYLLDHKGQDVED
jgi:hypothetical protein